MAVFKPQYSTASTLTITLASMANNTANSSAVIDNGTDLDGEKIVHVKIQANSTGVSSTGYVDVCVHPSVDDSTSFAGTTATGAATGITKRASGFKIAGRIPLTANSQVNELTFSIAALFGGNPPKRSLLSVENKSGAALDSTAGNHFIKYQGVQYQSV